MDYSLIDDKELFDKLQKSDLAYDFLNSETGKLLKEGSERIIMITLYELCYKADLANIGQVARLVERIRQYKFELFRDIELLKQDGEMVFRELRDRDKLRVPDTESGSGEQTP